MTLVSIICNATTVIIVGAIIYITYFHRRTAAAKTELPDLVTSLGVLGTFIGIVLGLLDFNPKDIEASVPNLLEGLKTAFITSIAGMGAAYYLKGGFSFFRRPNPTAEVDAEALEIDNLLTLLRDVVGSQKAGQKSLAAIELAIGGNGENAIATQLNSLKTSVAGDGETSIHTQMTKLRTELRDKQDELIKEFRLFASQMAENNSKAFIQALEQVIRDFNTKISEQFGDNFKQLNSAVGQLLTWQENYKSQVEKMVSQLDQNSEAIQKIRESFDHIAERSEAYVSTAERLGQLLTKLQQAEITITENLTTLGDISTQARTLLPQLEGTITSMSSGVAKIFQDSVSATAEALKKHNDAVSKEFEGFAQAAKKLEDNVESVMERTSTNISRMVDENGKTIAKSVETLDVVLEEELKKSMTSLGRHLASLSEKFVSDYAPLTDKLQKLVEAAKKSGN